MNAPRVVVAGANGRMGRLCMEALAQAGDLHLVGGIGRHDDPAILLDRSRADILLDFTHLEASRELACGAAERGLRVVVGTSGWSADDLADLRSACARGGVGGLVVPNFSLGAVLQMRAAAEAARHFPAAAIHEAHHLGKRDAPSGTARATASRIAAACGRAPPITSERLPDILAVQDVLLESPSETLLLRHEVRDRRAYLPGVLLALRRVGALHELSVGLEAVLELG